LATEHIRPLPGRQIFRDGGQLSPGAEQSGRVLARRVWGRRILGRRVLGLRHVASFMLENEVKRGARAWGSPRDFPAAGQAAVDREDSAGGVGGQRRGEKNDGRRYLIGRCGAAERKGT